MDRRSRVQYSQKRREREVFRYLPKFDWEKLQPAQNGVQEKAGETTRPHISKSSVDKALNAFAQLGALRLRSKRAMISLIDRDTQYIIAESTQTLSSQSDHVYQPGDSLLMGVRRVRRTEGLCGYALESGFRRDCRCPQREHDDNEKEGGGTDADVQMRLGATILSDLTKDEQFKDAPFVVNEPKTLFYAGVPIRTKAGYTIGSYCVMDNTPRPGISDAELEFLQDMALTVMDHLEFMTIRDDHGRSQQMLKALGLFVEGRSSVSEWWLRTSDKEPAPIPYNSASHSREESDVEGESQIFKGAGDSSTQTTSSEQAPRNTDQYRSSSGSNHKPRKSNDSARSDQTHHKVPRKASEDGLDETIEQMALNLKRHNEAKPRQEKQDSRLPAEARMKNDGTPSSTPKTDLSPGEFKAMFSRASNLIRESTGVDGAIFFDASFKGFGAKAYRRNTKRRDSELSSNEDSSRHRVSDTNDACSSSVDSTPDSNPLTSSTSSNHPAKPQYCEVLGFSTEATSSLNGEEAASHHLTVPDVIVSRILRRYPHGKIFAFDEDGGISSNEEDILRTDEKGTILSRKNGDQIKRNSSRKDEAASILQIFPGSRYIMVFPLWDFHREKWYASSMLWTSDPTRVLTAKDDMSYMASFSNNIMAEVFRLEVHATDRAKSTFISSISHELRSPLHGIMGSLELLHDTSLTRFQDETMDAIKQCSTTLLDTLNHVLDFAKINNFITGQRKEMKLAKRYKRSRKARPAEGVAQYGAISLASNFSLDAVTEEVVQAIYLGHHQVQLSTTTDLADELRSPKGSGPLQQQVLVILDVDWASRWRFHGQSGAWRRILMNLFGNALKYTTSGFVNVRLECQEGGKSKSHSNVTLTVSDSGKGVSTGFIEDRIFTPFAQEDSLSPGTGLGLSIVRQIVESLNGTIDFQSVLGSGTSVTVTLPLSRSTHLNSSMSGDAVVDHEVVSQAKAYVKNKKLGFVIADESSGSETQGVENNARKEALVLLHSALLRMARQCFDVETLSGVDLKHFEADIYVTTQEGFERSQEHARKPALGSKGGSPLIVIANPVSSKRWSQPGLPLSFLSYPVTPRKFANAILSIFEPGNVTATFIGKQAQELTGAVEAPKPATASPPPMKQDQILPPSSSPSLLKPKTTTAEASRSRLLLVEDNAINMKLLSTYVRRLDYDFDTATDGSLALEYYKEAPQKPAVILMDISMPVMDGFTSARLIRAYEAENNLPATTIIALTGLASASAQQESYSSGINLFLSKPVPMKIIKKVLEDLHLDPQTQQV